MEAVNRSETDACGWDLCPNCTTQAPVDPATGRCRGCGALNPYALVKGKTYRLEDDPGPTVPSVPIMPWLNVPRWVHALPLPRRVDAITSRMLHIYSGQTIRILSIAAPQQGTRKTPHAPWYEVEVWRGDDPPFRGWIDSIALVPWELQESAGLKGWVIQETAE